MYLNTCWSTVRGELPQDDDSDIAESFQQGVGPGKKETETEEKKKNMKELFIVSTVVWVYPLPPTRKLHTSLRTLDELIDLPPQLLFTQLILRAPLYLCAENS